MSRIVLLTLLLISSSFAQAPQPVTALDLLKRALVEFRAIPQPVISYGHDTPDDVKIRELENRVAALKKRVALVAEIEQFIRDSELPSRVRVVPTPPTP